MNTQAEVRRLNRLDILSLMRTGRCRSQAELADATGLRASTVSYAIRDLRNLNLVRREGHVSSGAAVGKRRTLLGLNPEAGSYIGLMVRRTGCNVSVHDFSGATVERVHYPLNGGSGPDDLIEQLAALVSGHLPPRLLGIGVAVASVVLRDGSIAPSADFPATVPGAGESLHRALAESVPETVPVVVENDANCIALHGYQLDHGSNTLSLVLSSDPVTMGAGLVIDGAIYRGSSGGAGEILSFRSSHVPEETSLDGEILNTVIRFTDPDVVVIARDRDAGPWAQIDSALSELEHRHTRTVTNPDASLSGVLQLVWETSVTALLEEPS